MLKFYSVDHILIQLPFLSILIYLEPSSGMINVLRNRTVYRNIYQSYLGGGHKANNIQDETYDLIIISGGFAKGHLPVDCLEEVVRIGKQGMW